MKKLFLLFLLGSISFGQLLKKHELRGAWIATVANIDWPKSKDNSVQEQKNNLIYILEYLDKSNINSIYFQARPTADALYKSNIEPWSYWLTGKQGKAPEDNFDPLEFITKEAHKRGMELHVWINPYRIKNSNYNFTLANNNVAVKHPEWVLNINNNLILNPGLPEVRNYIVDVINDIITRYNVDGIHFDDYFYLEGISSEDYETFQKYSNGFIKIDDWRRYNVNELIRMVYEEINSYNSNIKFGVSPAGIWKNNVPSGIVGRDNYSVIYCDAIAWLNNQTIDYLAPQLYWKFGGNQDYAKLLPWWVFNRNNRHIYPGLALYRVGDSNFDKSQIGKMISLNRKYEGAEGQIFFTSHNFKENPDGITDTLKTNYFKYKALIPHMNWKDNTVPSEVTDLRYGKVSGNGITAITWNKNTEDDLFGYVIYKSENSINNSTKDQVDKIYKVTSDNYYIPDNNDVGFHFAVTAIDKNGNESNINAFITYSGNTNIPEVPLLAYPNNEENNVPQNAIFNWYYSKDATSYDLEISYNNNFTLIYKRFNSIKDTSFTVKLDRGEYTYYWRVRSINNNGNSDYSDIYSFTTGFPGKPLLVSPKNFETEISINPTLTWEKNTKADKYRVELYEGTYVFDSNKLIDSLINTTEIKLHNLKSETIYSWRVSASNTLGNSEFSDLFMFKTMKDTTSDVNENSIFFSYSLSQNYPNPFNPTTKINFTLSKDGKAKLLVYNVLGEVVKTLFDKYYSKGNYSVIFDGSTLPSGVYFYRLIQGEFNSTKKMILIK